MRYTEKEKSFLLILAGISIVCFLICSLSTIAFGIPPSLEALFLLSGYLFTIYIIQLSFLCLLFLSLIGFLIMIIAGIAHGVKKQLNNKIFICALFINIIYLILYYPFYYYPVSYRCWYVIDFSGIIFILIMFTVGDKIKNLNKKTKKIISSSKHNNI
jgi:hypothetical protein